MEMEEASNSTQMDLDKSDLELDVEKNVDKGSKRKTTGSKRKAPTKKKPKTEGQEQKSKWWKFFDTVYEEDEDGDQVKKGKCKFCSRLIAAYSHTNDILAIQISTVASESAFSTDSLEDLFNDDEIVKDMEYELEKTSKNDKGEQNVE
ncbi:hypothetical protein Tco_1034178 [Tanacetum coccineum]